MSWSFQCYLKLSSRTLQESAGHPSCGVNVSCVCTNVILKFAFHFQFLSLVCAQQFTFFALQPFGHLVSEL